MSSDREAIWKNILETKGVVEDENGRIRFRTIEANKSGESDSDAHE